MSDIVKLERAVIETSLARLAEWEKDNPEGLLPLRRARTNTLGRQLVAATIALRDAKAKAKGAG